MQKYNTRGIILGRTNYGEAARIITFLTPDRGKVRAMAKGVRKAKSKLAGGVELFSVSDIGILPGRGEVATLVSSRLIKHYGHIVEDLDRTGLAYELIKKIDKNTAEHPEAAYFELLTDAFEALDAEPADIRVIEAWFSAQLIKMAGHAPDLRTDKSGVRLTPDNKYDFNYDSMNFEPGETFGANHIKYLRLLFSGTRPDVLLKIKAGRNIRVPAERLIKNLAETF